ncbi:MAG: hypothetical protein ACKPJD_08550, partial [Planctomycetaceae bacterium]
MTTTTQKAATQPEEPRCSATAPAPRPGSARAVAIAGKGLGLESPGYGIAKRGEPGTAVLTPLTILTLAFPFAASRKTSCL